MALAQRAAQSTFLGSSGPAVARVSAVRPAVASRRAAAPQALFGGLFGGSKQSDAKGAAAAPQSYICVDCGFIYPEGDFKKAPGSYRCPVCNSPKSRFKVYKGPVKGKPNNTQSAMRQRLGAKQW